MHTETELKAMDAVTLRQVAKGLKINPSGMKGPDIIRAVLKAQSGATPADPDAKKKRVATTPAESPPDDETPPEEAKAPPPPPPVSPTPKAGKTEKVKASGKSAGTEAPPSEEGWKAMMESRLGLLEAAILSIQKGVASAVPTLAETPAPPPAKSRKKEATPPAPPPAEIPEESGEVPGVEDEAELTPQLVMEMSFEELLAVAKDNQVPLGKKETLKSLQEKFLKMLGAESPEESPEDMTPPAEDEAPPAVAEVGPGVAELSAKIQAGTVTNIKFADGKLGRTVAVYFPDDEEFGPRIFRGEIAKSVGDDAGKFWRKNEGVNELCISFPDDETQAWIPLGAVFDGEHIPQKPAPKKR